MTERIIRAIDEQELIGRVADTLQPVVRQALGSLGSEVKDALHGKWLGHPVHPALVSLPIGAWTLAFLFDVAEVMRGKKSGLPEAAISVGLAGAVASAITGFADWSETDGRGKKVGVVHATLNMTATALYVASLGTRRRSRQAGIGLSLLAFGLANAAAYLGGHLAFGEQIGVNHTEAPTSGKPESFVAVLRSDELADNTMVRVMAEGVAILLVRRNDRIFAIAETCTHLGGPLSEGKLDGNTVQCPWHGSRFCIEDGRVDRGPATFPARTFEVRERAGSIEVRALQA
ncbi:MAG TPA: Rieske 2Fe-2S domain-containing protein [Thermoanaerobaculia bacterium]